jgi:hypothetical protein
MGASERTDWHGDGFPATGSRAWGFCDNARPRNDDKQGKESMRTRTRRTLAATLALTLVVSTAALASGPLKGKTYEGGAPSTGVKSEGHHQVTLHAGGNIVLRVAGNGKSVTVRFSSSAAVLYCRTPQLLHSQSTKPASISRSGTFRAAITQKFSAGAGRPASVQVVTGRFSGHTVSGTIHTEAGECGGVATFSARAR